MEHQPDLAAYIDAACDLHRLPLTAEEKARVTQTISLTAKLVEPLMALELPAEVEAAPVFQP